MAFKERLLFLIYLGVLIFLSITRMWEPILVVFILCLPLISIKKLGPIIGLLFVVSVPYLAWGYTRGEMPLYWFGLFNLRALAMFSFTMAFFSIINPFRALSFSRTFSMVLSLSYAQYMSFSRTFKSFSQALRSRTVKKRLGKSFSSYAGAVFKYFLDLSERRSNEVTQALKSRGFYVQNRGS